MRAVAIRSALIRYAVALIAVAVAVATRVMLGPLLGERLLFITLFPAVVFAAWFGGRGPGVAALGASLLAGIWFLPPPGFALPAPKYALDLGLFSVFGAALIAMVESLRAAWQRASDAGELLRVTLASIGDGVITTDARGHVTAMNAIAESLTGWQAGAAAGQPLDAVFRLVNEDTGQPVESPAMRALRGGAGVGLANPDVLISRDATRRPIEDSVAAIRDGGGGVIGSVVVFRDATRRRLQQRELEEREAQFRTLAESIPQLAWMAHPDGHIFWYNRRWYEYTGTTLEQMQGWGWQSVHDADELPRVLERWQASIELGAPLDMVFPLRGSDGVFRPFLTRIAPIKDEHGRVVRWFGTNTDISEQKRAEEQLRQIGQSSREILESITDAFFALDPQWRFSYVNPQAERLLGRAPGALLGRDIWQEFPGLVGSEFERAYRNAAADRVSRSAVAYYPDHERWYESNVYPATHGISVYMRDVSEQRRATAELARLTQASEQQRRIYETALSNTADFNYVFDLRGRIVYVNAALLSLWGRQLHEVVGRNFFELDYPPEFAARLQDQIRTVIETRASLIDEMPHASDAGERIYEYIFVPVLAQDGSVEAVTGSTRDVTERKRGEAALAAQKRALELLVEGAPLADVLDALCETMEEQGTRPLFAMVQLVDASGQRLRSIAGRRAPPGYLQEVDGIEIGPVAGSCGTAAFRGEPVLVSDIASDPLWADYREIALRHGLRACWSTPIFSTRRKVLGTFAVHYPVPGGPTAEERRLADVLIRTASVAVERRRDEEALRQADRRKDEFLATLAHELRNPLAPVKNSLELMRRAPGDAEIVERAQATMERQIAHMVRLIDDLLDVSRITQNKLELRSERIELKPVIEHAVEACRPQYEQAGHQLVVSLPPEPVWLDADPMRLAQVFSNLLNNACKYTPRGGRVSLIAQHGDGTVTVTISDTGAGIPRAMLAQVFELFTQVNQTLERSEGGLGIGLSLVKWLVELHGGTVSARSEGLGSGSEFVVTLPVATAPAAIGQPRRAPRAAEPVARRRRVLVVDDNVDSAESLAILLDLGGHEIQTANDGVDAVTRAGAFRPDLILLDLGMPKLNGYDACRQIRAQPWGRDVTIVAMTGWGQEEDRMRSRDAGFDAHVVKPLEYSALLELMERTPAVRR